MYVIFLMLHNIVFSTWQFVLFVPNMKHEWPIILQPVQRNMRIKLILDLIMCVGQYLMNALYLIKREMQIITW